MKKTNLRVINGGLESKSTGGGKQRKLYAFIVSSKDTEYRPTKEITCEGECKVEKVSLFTEPFLSNADSPFFIYAENEEQAKELGRDYILNHYLEGDTENKDLAPIIILGEITQLELLSDKMLFPECRVTYSKVQEINILKIINSPHDGEYTSLLLTK